MEPRGNNRIIVILGPTSSGKSTVAIKLARKFNGGIISADSRQIYRGMDLGTGKIPRSKFISKNLNTGLSNKKMDTYWSEGIVHYLIDIVEPKAKYNVVNFKKDAGKIIINILERKKVPIICGGTGFWIKSLVDDVNFPKVKPNWKLRETLGKSSAKNLFAMLTKLDSERAKSIDQNNKVRLIRAIEICKVIGKVPREVKRQASTANYKFLQIGVAVPRPLLNEKIKKRLEKRFQEGMIKEVEKLRKKGLGWKKIQSFGLGYYWIPLYLKGKITLEELHERVYLAEKDYAKRQMTWFKKDERIVWLKNYKDIEKEVKKFLS